MKTFGSRLEEIRLERGFKTKTALAKKLGGKITHNSIGKWEGDDYMPGADAIERLKKTLLVNWDYLVSGKGSKYLDQSLDIEKASKIDYMYRYPVLDWTEIKKGVSMTPTMESVNEFSSSHNSSSCFALTVNNESMQPEFKVGEQILIDKSITVKNGDFCIIRLPDKNHVLRQLFEEGSDKFIKAANPDWPNRLKELNIEMEIIGKVIESRRSYNN